MLQNEPENQQSAIPAAQIRVPAEELTAAINALEEQTAQHLEGTVPIGQVVHELHLNVTSEEIWAEVQKQRQAATVAQTSAATQSVAQLPVRTRPHWHKRWWLIFGIGLAIYGVVHGNIEMVNGDNEIQTYNAAGKVVLINGDDCTITLHGKPRSVIVNGDDDIIITDIEENITTNGDNDTVTRSSSSAPKHP